MDDQDYQLLTMLEQTSNITHAANRLYITQSSISKRIYLLEKELGITLMIRSRQGIHFTPEGEIVLHHIHAVLDELGRMKQELNQSQNLINGTLRAGISINYAFYRLPDQLAAYKKRYPLVDTQLTTANSRELYQLLLNGQIDLAVLRGEYRWKGERLLLSREKLCIITDTADENRPLTDFPQISRRTDIELEREISQWMRENKIMPTTRGILVDNIATCVEMVRRGLGWCIVPEICLTDFSGSIRPMYFADGEPLLRSTYLMYSQNALQLPQVRAFVDIMKNQISLG